MIMSMFNESIVEGAAPGLFGELGCAIAHGPYMVPSKLTAEQNLFGDVVLVRPSFLATAILRDTLRQKLLSGALPSK